VILVRLDEAAEWAATPLPVVRGWVARGLITPVEQDKRGRDLYDLAEVLRVEHEQRTGVSRRRRIEAHLLRKARGIPGLAPAPRKEDSVEPTMKT
jgi:hypothetical protein